MRRHVPALLVSFVSAPLGLAGCSPMPAGAASDMAASGPMTAPGDMAWARWPMGPPPFSVRIPTVMMQPGQEITDFYSATLPNEAPAWIQKVGWIASEGLHHSQVNIGDNPLSFSLSVGQRTGAREFPIGYAMPVRARQQMFISYHFVNAAGTVRPADVEVQFFPIADPVSPAPRPTSLVPFLYEPIRIPARSMKQIEATCTLPRDVEVHGMLSHIHRFGRQVRASVVGGAHDGLLLYSTELWENAPIDEYHPPIQLAKGDAIRFSCRWQNDSDAEVTWGAKANEEMCGVAAWMSPVDNDLFAKVTVEGGPCQFGLP